MKVDFSNFSDKLDVEAFLYWVKNVESSFKYMEIAKDKKVKMVALKLKLGASAWWDQIQVNCKQILYQQYQPCRQGNRKVAEYAEEFHYLSAGTQTNESENCQIARFVDGLKEDIHEQLDLQPIATLPAAILMALKAKMKLEKRQKNSGTKKN
ncbi:uncharacterized protein E6C27_scaffold274G002800 [Cucumis melo var. makuwa]|uniref:Retrotransposon gag domain-containing protein n=1 Tax=Cucumis melo var. makuwa TaxID=1194695 RepID=A0A5A7UUZ0_CUCMM|nr:uncharacterized protein E6C27_scaffold274G002800 [Cucumis melo var. makuwa]